jgi:glucan phosphorylase
MAIESNEVLFTPKAAYFSMEVGIDPKMPIYHMNEGHSALLSISLLKEQVQGKDLASIATEHIEKVRQKCVFTTHTPVPAGHDVSRWI